MTDLFPGVVLREVAEAPVEQVVLLLAVHLRHADAHAVLEAAVEVSEIAQIP